MYDGPAFEGEIKAYRGSAARSGVRASRGEGSRTERPARPARPTGRRSAAVATRTDSRVGETRQQSLRAYGAGIQRDHAAAASRSNASAGRRSPTGRGVALAGGAAAMTVGKAMVDVARPAAAAAAPMLRVVAGGLDRVPTGSVAGPAARGRILIVVAGLLAAGLIYINVGKLEAGDGYGRYAQRSLELQRDNTILRGNVARLSSSERIVRRAQKLGMVMPQPEQFKYLYTRRGDALKAMRTYTAPTNMPVAVVSPQTSGQTSGLTSGQTFAAPPPAVPTGAVKSPATGTAPATTPRQVPTAPPATGAPPPATPGAVAPGTTNGAAVPGGH
jgi:hypothetical protein